MYKLFGKSSSGKTLVWEVNTNGSSVVVTYGQEGGKMSSRSYEAFGKNIGKSNETSPASQAHLEMESLLKKQLKKGYFFEKEDAQNHKEFTPIRAQNSDDYKHKLVFPCYIQPKLNGQRLMIDEDGNAWSKQGEPLQFPEHWTGVVEAAKMFGGLDGEVYAGLESEGGLSLQKIISAFRKKNSDTPKLKLWVYDLPLKNFTFASRAVFMDEIAEKCEADEIMIVEPSIVDSWEDAVRVAKSYVKVGYEGAMLRNFDGEYEFGKRSYDLQKLKFRLDAEAVVVSVTQDKNEDGVLLCQAINGKQTGVQFECLMRKDADPDVNYRKYSNALLLIGKAITYEYEELSDKGVPTKPVAVGVREMLNGEGRY